jgi:hypothetical protein
MTVFLPKYRPDLIHSVEITSIALDSYKGKTYSSDVCKGIEPQFRNDSVAGIDEGLPPLSEFIPTH